MTTAATASTTTPQAAPALEDCGVIELRDYTLRAGQRELLIDLFERELIEPQEAAGLRVIATFRDLDRPDHFVWLRGCADMAARRRGLEAFYGGPVWQRHRDVANATMIDSDDVRLLRYARPAWALATPPLPRPRLDDDDAPSSLFLLTLCRLAAPVDVPWRRWFERDPLPLLRDAAAMPCAVLETEPAPNDFPRLAVRSGEHIFAWLSRHAAPTAGAQALQRLAASARWTHGVLPRLSGATKEAPRVLRLQPTARSLLR